MPKKPKRLQNVCGGPDDTLDMKLICDPVLTHFKGAKIIINKKEEDICARSVDITQYTNGPPFRYYRVLEEHNYFVKKERVREMQEAVAEVGVMCNYLQNEISGLKRIVTIRAKLIANLTSQIIPGNKFNQKPPSPRFTWKHFLRNPQAFKAFTGFDNETKFQHFMETLIPVCVIAVQLPQYNMLLPLEDQIFLTLTRFKLGFNDKNLVELYNITNAIMEKMWEFWLDLFYQQFTRVRIWPKKVRNKPRTIVLDTTEVLVSYKCLEYGSAEFQNRVRTLLGFTSEGLICFVGDLYSGGLSDVEVIVKSDILKMLQKGDEVIVDDGVLIEDFVKEGIILRRPCNAGDDNDLRKITATRSVAERVIKSVKSYRIFDMTHTHELTLQIFKICCYLVNFNRDDFAHYLYSLK